MCVPVVVIPVIAFCVALATQLVMAVLGLAMVPAWRGGSGPLSFLPGMTLSMVYGLIVHALWHAPLYAWILLVSAWAKRTPFLFVVLPAVLLAIVERIVFGTAYVRGLVRYRLIGAIGEAFSKQPDGSLGVSPGDPLRFLATPGLWIGLAAAALFLAIAVRVRRHNDPI
jgi:ABC-2 type transport system permease protein